MFEHHFHFQYPNIGSSIPTYLEIAMANYAFDAFFSLVRYDIQRRRAKCLLFVKSTDDLKMHLKKPPLTLQDVGTWIGRRESMLARHPLLILDVILSLIQSRSHEYTGWRQDVYAVESMLGETRDWALLQRDGYPKVSDDLRDLNADLAGFARRVADVEVSASTILEHSKALQRLIVVCESDEKHSPSMVTTEQREVIQATITRELIWLKHVKMMQDMVQNHRAVLYNRINRHDTQSMKTIAVVTLFLLPATLVSTIFSTLLSFDGPGSLKNKGDATKYSWIYFLACMLASALALVSWLVWYVWGREWLEKLIRKQINDPPDL